jgi:hypothetical protein
MARHFLPGLLGVRSAAPTDPMPLEWVADIEPGPAWQQTLSIRIARTLGTFDRDPAAIVRSLPEGLVLLVTTIQRDHWDSHERARVAAFLAYWNSFPDLPPNRSLVVGVSVVKTRRTPSTAELDEAFPAEAYPAIRFRVLPELKSPLEWHAQTWLSRREVKQWYNWEIYRDSLRGRISKLYSDRPAIPMRDLAQPLIEALESCN